MAHEAAIDQRVHSRCFVGEQGIQHVRRNTMPACLRFDDQRRELLGAVGMATQLSDADPWYGAPVTPQHTDHIGSQLLPAFFNAVTVCCVTSMSLISS